MIKQILYALVLTAVAVVGGIAIKQSLSHKREVPKVAQEPTPEVKTVEVKDEKPLVEVPFGPEKSNFFFIKETPQHVYRAAFIGGIFPQTFPEDGFNEEVASGLLDIIASQNVQLLFLADSIRVPKESGEKYLELLRKKLTGLYDLTRSKLGGEVRIFPAIDCTLADAPRVMPVVEKAFQLETKDPTAPYGVMLENSAFLVLQTHQYDPAGDLLNALRNIFDSLQPAPKNLFVVGFDSPFPITAYAANDRERKQFWKLLIEERVTAFFSFSEQVFNRVYQKGVWQIIAGGGGGPTRTQEDIPPFYHCLIVRIPAEGDARPSVQVLDIKGNVVDEFELSETNNPLHQLHISG